MLDNQLDVVVVDLDILADNHQQQVVGLGIHYLQHRLGILNQVPHQYNHYLHYLGMQVLDVRLFHHLGTVHLVLEVDQPVNYY